MALTVRIEYRSSNPNTIWARLAEKLGREPKHWEAVAEVKRIKAEALADLATRGRMRHQHRR